jgi:hypothetical protein
MSQLPQDTSCQAEYADGFILDETENDDLSIYFQGENTFRDILRKRPEAKHGPMVRFSVFYKDERHDIDWGGLPANARPIRFRDRTAWLQDDGSSGVTDWHGCRFGYQYTENGRNTQEVTEL